MTNDTLQVLLEKSKDVKMTPAELELQRRSFAYGNTNIDNSRVARRIVDEQAQKLGCLASKEVVNLTTLSS